MNKDLPEGTHRLIIDLAKDLEDCLKTRKEMEHMLAGINRITIRSVAAAFTDTATKQLADQDELCQQIKDEYDKALSETNKL